MTDSSTPAAPDLTTLTVQLLSAYLANNKLDHGELPGLIQSTRTALGEPAAAPTPEPAPAEAGSDHRRAVSVKKSLASPDHIISMVDGKPYKTLRRHLAKHGLSPEEYRARYKLPANYPMVAPGYSEQRRRVARDLGLGRRRAAPVELAEPTPAEEAAPAAAASEPPVEAAAKPRTRRATVRRQPAAPSPAPQSEPAPRSGRRRKATAETTA